MPLVVALPGRSRGAHGSDSDEPYRSSCRRCSGWPASITTRVRKTIAPGFTDALPLVGRDLSPLIRGEVPAEKVAEPIYFMTDDDPSRGLDQKNFIGIAYDSVAQPNHVETRHRGDRGRVWKYSRYFDHPRYWSAPGTPGADGVRDVVARRRARGRGRRKGARGGSTRSA